MATTPESIEVDRQLKLQKAELERVLSQMPASAVDAISQYLSLLERRSMLSAATANADVETRRAQGAYLAMADLSMSFVTDKAMQARPKPAAQMRRRTML